MCHGTVAFDLDVADPLNVAASSNNQLSLCSETLWVLQLWQAWTKRNWHSWLIMCNLDRCKRPVTRLSTDFTSGAPFEHASRVRGSSTMLTIDSEFSDASCRENKCILQSAAHITHLTDLLSTSVRFPGSTVVQIASVRQHIVAAVCALWAKKTCLGI